MSLFCTFIVKLTACAGFYTLLQLFLFVCLLPMLLSVSGGSCWVSAFFGLEASPLSPFRFVFKEKELKGCEYEVYLFQERRIMQLHP
jgi:hypothetical protein